MDNITDTGEWTVQDFRKWEIQQYLQKPQRCEHCRKVDIGLNMVRLNRDSVPGSVVGFYHPKCAKIARIRYKKICAFCHNWFVMNREDGVSEVCPNCYHGENKRMYKILVQERYAARKCGLSNTLTMSEWLETLDHFERTCAYCGTRPYTDIEHFVPIVRGGGTTRDNCVPSCGLCNSRKRNHDAFAVFPSIAPRLAEYLKSRE